MGEQTGIEWTDHTFNPWWGCTRVSPGCEHCYAETWAARFGVKWGVKAERRSASRQTWGEPRKWNAAAERDGRRHRVFCASMADVFEDRRDLDAPRERLFALIRATPWLDWQLLTKRPDAVMRMVPESWRGGFPPNVWIGTTVEDQRRADERIPHLMRIPARVRFLSCEPLLGPVDLSHWLNLPAPEVVDDDYLLGHLLSEGLRDGTADCKRAVDWVICGGESGPGARPMHPDWARSLRDQCKAAGVPFFFKQWGEWAPSNRRPGDDLATVTSHEHAKGCGFFTYNDDWVVSDCGGNPFRQTMVRVGKKAAGSLLDGVEHKAFPA